jgi:hypothetical protein
MTRLLTYKVRGGFPRRMMIAEDETGDREPRLASATGGYRRDETSSTAFLRRVARLVLLT